jgi:glycosyltransferase involved in cell wall biosynthesis
MNIVLYVNNFLPNLGGRQFVVHYLADALQRLGHDVRVVKPSGFVSQRHFKAHYPIHRWPTLRGLFRDQVAKAQLRLDTAIWGCDVLHAHNTYPTGYHALKARGRARYPVIITPHGIDINTIPEVGHGLRLNPVLNRKITQAVGEADAVTAISSHIESMLLDAGAPAERMWRIPNGVDLDRFNGSTVRDVRRWLKLPEDSRLLITIGAYNPRKGQDYLIRAMPEILAAEPAARLVIVGKGAAALQPLVASLGLEDKVVFAGAISPPSAVLGPTGPKAESGPEPDRLADLLRSGAVYVSAGIDNNAEGLSLAVLESMASRLPVVATSISGNVNVVTHEDNGLLVRPADSAEIARAVIRVLGEPGLAHRLRTRGRETVESMSWLEVAKQYVALYEEAIARRRAELR